MTLHLNCDMGERCLADDLDLALLPQVDLINIAVGGHAGDQTIARDLARRAADLGIACALHPAYPDRAGFGRRSRWLRWSELVESLAVQRAILPTVTTMKPHGALYNDTAADPDLAGALAAWCQRAGITTVLTPPDSALAEAVVAVGLEVLAEGFADRAYIRTDTGLALQARDQAGAVHDDPQLAVAQVAQALTEGQLPLADGTTAPFDCATWCVHSDSPGALATVTALRTWAAAC